MDVSSTSSSTSLSLVERVRSLDQDAWRRMCYVYGPLVYQWCRNAGLQGMDAADVGQEVFLTVANRIASFDGQKPGATFRGWLWTITRNKLGDHLRRQAHQPDAGGGSAARQRLEEVPELPVDESTASGSFNSTGSVLHRTLDVVRAEFEATTWQAFWQATIDGRPSADIAEDLGMTAAAVRQAKYRVLRRLRREVADA